MLHAPRQTGKTSALITLRDLFNSGATRTSRPSQRCGCSCSRSRAPRHWATAPTGLSAFVGGAPTTIECCQTCIPKQVAGLTDRAPPDTVRHGRTPLGFGGPRNRTAERFGDIDMALKINVTWPEPLPQVCIAMRCSGMAPISKRTTKDGVHITVDGAFGLSNRVCDEDRYRIGRESEGLLECCEPGADFEQTLVLLLESPHEHEYANNCVNRPLAPALGATGLNIRKHLMSVIGNCEHLYNRLASDVKVRVIVANPIQFQCSLVSVIKKKVPQWKKNRDAVWKALWSQQPILDEFRERLEGYRANFIVNACTHDVTCRSIRRDPECQKRKVRDLLVRDFPNAHIYESPHPSSWWRSGNRRLTHICTS